jgi:hypothetical protein
LGEGTPGWTLGRRDNCLTPAGVRTLCTVSTVLHVAVCIVHDSTRSEVLSVPDDWPLRGNTLQH